MDRPNKKTKTIIESVKVIFNLLISTNNKKYSRPDRGAQKAECRPRTVVYPDLVYMSYEVACLLDGCLTNEKTY